MNLENKKVLVTGGAGFIGSHTADRLIAKGAKVVIIDNLISGKKDNVNPKAKFYEMNVADPKIEGVFKKEKPEIVFHFAFNVLVPKSVKNPLLDMDSIKGSVNIFINASNFGVKRVVFSSSEFIYGNSKNFPIKEAEPLDPLTSYSIAKYTVESYLKFFRRTRNLNYVILRLATIYGKRRTNGAIPDYIRKLTSGRQAEIWGNGEKTRDYVYIDDAVRANLMALDLADNYPNPVFNVGTGIETSLNEVYWKIAELLGKEPKPVYFPDRPGEQKRCCLDYSKIKKVLGWKPEINLDEGLKLLIKNLNI
jgi:UDP-glucose 4-epimerase